jgi:RNA polymerase sigma-70 factor, ECF subfamily
MSGFEERPRGPEPAFDLDRAEDWARLFDAVGPAMLLVAVRDRVGPKLAERVSAEDVLQETWLHAWRDRASHRFEGVAAFRKWLLTIASNRIRDLADVHGAEKRGAGRVNSWDAPWPEPLRSTTPSRTAMLREQADAVSRAFDALPAPQRDVLRLRLIEGLPLSEIAPKLGIGLSAAKHLSRAGAVSLRRLLARPSERP